MHTFIVVDDEPLIRKGTIKKIGTMNDTVTCVGEAANGREALDLIEKENPEIIVTDMYMPVMDGVDFLKILREKYTDKQIIVISGYRDFEYAKEALSSKAITYILKPFSRDIIQTSIRQAINNIENRNNILMNKEQKEKAEYNLDLNMLINLIMGYYPYENQALTSSRLSSILTKDNFVLMTIYSPLKIDLINFDAFLNKTGQKYFGIFLKHPKSSNTCFLMFFIPKILRRDFVTVCTQIANQMALFSKEKNIDFLVGISDPQESLGKLSSAYKETIDALNSKNLSDSSNIYFYNPEIKATKSFVWDNLDELLFRIENGESDKVKLLTGDLFKSLSLQTDMTFSDVKIYCMTIIQQAKSILSNYMETPMSNDISASIQNILNSIFSMDELNNYLCTLFCNLSEKIKDKSVYSGKDLIDQIKIYAQRNYYKNINMELISSLFYVNRSYCSHLFKDKTGENFVNYLNGIRIAKAMKLLKDSDKKMYIISKSVGYDNVKYFFRIFKQISGMSPENYRGKVRKTDPKR